jgi:hypothetical protein
VRDRRVTWRRTAFIAVWILGSVGLGWQVVQGRHTFDSQATVPALLALLVCTAALLWWLAGSAPEMPSTTARTRYGRFVLVVILAVGILFPLRTLIGPPLLFGLPVLGLVVLALLRPRLSRLEVVYALLLALVAGLAGLGASWVTFSPLTWAVLQVALVLPSLLAGWSLLRHTGLWQAGIGHSLLLTEGPVPALCGFARGVLIAVPWAFGLVVLGAANEETWVQSLWQPLVAIQPGIAEEAWGRVLLVPLLFLTFRPVAQGRTALTAAVVIMAYWFAYLHTSGGTEAVVSTVMIGTLFALPTSYLWLRRGLETAIGFHFWLDFVKFLVAYLLNHGLWLR